MAPLTKKLSYQNTDKQIEKFSEILQGILNNKQIKHKFELQNDMTGIARQKIAIYSQNVIKCLEFLMRHLRFWYNQTFELSSLYNENEEQVYNEMYTGKWW